MTTEILIQELERRGFHVIPKRCPTCQGNNDMEFRDNILVCVGCDLPTEECNC